VAGIAFVRARIWLCIGRLPSSQAILIGRTLLLSLLLLVELSSDDVSVLLSVEEAEEAMEGIVLLNNSIVTM